MHKFITPRVGCDVTLIILTLITTKFQSTLPVWGATPMQIPLPVRPIDFNPRSPCGERHEPHYGCGFENHISIHAPRVGSDRPGTNTQLPL